MADLITVDFGALESAATTCQAQANALQGLLDQLGSQVQQLVWTGAASISYHDDQTRWNTGAAEIRAVLAQIGAAVNQAAEAYQEAESTNAARFH